MPDELFRQTLDAHFPDVSSKILMNAWSAASMVFPWATRLSWGGSLSLFNFYGLQQDKENAIDHLTKAKAYWVKYAGLYDSKYKPAIYNRVGYVNIPSLIEKTDKDIEIARDWKLGAIKEYVKKTSTETPFKK